MSDTTQTEAKYRRSRRWNIVLGVAVIFLAVVVTAQLLPGQSPTSGSADASDSAAANAPTGEYQELDFVTREADDPMAIGDVDAPVVMTMWTDLRCPFCAVFARDSLPSLVENYVEDGRVRIEFQDIAFFGEQSAEAAVAAHAAANQDAYYEFMTTLYDAAPEKGHADLPREALIDFAEQSGVADIDRFTADLDDPELRAAVDGNTQYAQQIGVTSTPFFVAGNTSLSGAQPTANFEAFLDGELAQADAQAEE